MIGKGGKQSHDSEASILFGHKSAWCTVDNCKRGTIATKGDTSFERFRRVHNVICQSSFQHRKLQIV